MAFSEIRTHRPLAVFPMLTASRTRDSKLVLPRKFIDGMYAYAEAWAGPVKAVMHPDTQATDQLDNLEVAESDLPFEVAIVPFDDEARVRREVKGAGVVLGGPHHRLRNFSRVCRQVGVPSVYNTEYSLRTRLQIARSDTSNVLRLARRAAWETETEARIRYELRFAAGIQCNGLPTYEAYRDATPSPLLYFDNRISDDLLSTDAQLAERNRMRMLGKPLTLAFSGRWIAMKGVDHLVPFAHELRALGVPFELLICGGGALDAELRAGIEHLRLQDHVKLLGTLDFATELMPLIQSRVDLFVCCHRQGDPSCTYIETLACGVPIAGYLNEAAA